MRAINHALTGAVIAVAVGQPLIALPAALASHFILDAVPHFGINKDTALDRDIATPWFHGLMILDMVLCFGLVVIIFEVHNTHWLLTAVCAFVATLPDFMLVPRYYRSLRFKDLSRSTTHRLIRFHDKIQTQIPLGAVTELIWAAVMIFALAKYLN